MSETFHFFTNAERATCLALSFDLAERLGDWARLQSAMRRHVPDAFTRDEWAYLLAFVAPSNLHKPFVQAFGDPSAQASIRPSIFVRPRGQIAIWLPNNVSLLGPLLLVLSSLTGSNQRIKVGSHAQDLTAAFVNFALEHLPTCGLTDYFRNQVQIQRFDRSSPLNRVWAGEAKVRVIFGSDQAVFAIDSLPHPADSLSIVFGDHCSEVWVELPAFSNEMVLTLIKVFAVYGRAGCTSPRRVVVLGGTAYEVDQLKGRLAAAWEQAVRKDVPMHVASNNILEHQLALAEGWQSTLTPRHASVLVSGSTTAATPSGLMSLPIVAARLEEATASLPHNIQTIGHCLSNPDDPLWLHVLAESSIKRFVPLVSMHHFGPVWDGSSFWQRLFEEVVLQV